LPIISEHLPGDYDCYKREIDFIKICRLGRNSQGWLLRISKESCETKI
jgi:hypothetical protein